MNEPSEQARDRRRRNSKKWKQLFFFHSPTENRIITERTKIWQKLCLSPFCRKHGLDENTIPNTEKTFEYHRIDVFICQWLPNIYIATRFDREFGFPPSYVALSFLYWRNDVLARDSYALRWRRWCPLQWVDGSRISWRQPGLIWMEMGPDKMENKSIIHAKQKKFMTILIINKGVNPYRSDCLANTFWPIRKNVALALQISI